MIGSNINNKNIQRKQKNTNKETNNHIGHDKVTQPPFCFAM